MKKVKYVCFDMDGTIADLYSVENWLPKLRAFDPSPYVCATPMWDMTELNKVLVQVQAKGIKIVIISWLSLDSNRQYDDDVRKAKREWLINQNFPTDYEHYVKYGTTKADTIRKYVKPNESAILIDDNKKVRCGWSLGDTVDPTTVDIIEYLKTLVE
jgi:2-hydroxy-3-keto-5-methylthiopentenyl-1-phosphate phosphatase